jgi:hypothetical protein
MNCSNSRTYSINKIKSEKMINQFFYQAEYLASRGMIAARADYRVKNRQGGEPDKSVEDGKSALRWQRGNHTPSSIKIPGRNQLPACQINSLWRLATLPASHP